MSLWRNPNPCGTTLPDGVRDEERGKTVAKNEVERGPDYLEKTFLLPRSLWDRLEGACDREDREPSEMVAEALRSLLSNGGAPASVAGVQNGDGPRGRVAALAAGSSGSPVQQDLATANALENQLSALYAEPVGSEKLATRLREIMARVETRDHFIDSHSEKVAKLARTVAVALGVAGDQLAVIETGALAHDLGKSHVPGDVLGKKGRLTSEEWALVKRYPEFSAEMLAPFQNLAPVVEVVRHHQERWDGSGYPDGLQGDAIPLGAQIVGVCDVFDVLTSDRAYRPALPRDVAIKTIEGGVGRLWNPDVASALIRAAGS